MTPPIPNRDELPFRRLERAHLNRERCLRALVAADDELQEAINALAVVGYDVRCKTADAPLIPLIPVEPASRRA